MKLKIPFLILFYVLTAFGQKDECKAGSYDASNVAASRNKRAVVTTYFCANTWVLNRQNNYCYKSHTMAKTWAAAHAFCRGGESHLASVHSLQESRFIVSLMPRSVQATHCDDIVQGWIGLVKNGPNSRWRWSDGTAFNFTNWGQNWVPGYTKQPDGRAIHHCGEIRKYVVCKGTVPGDFNDDHCNRALHHFICKKPAFYRQTVVKDATPPPTPVVTNGKTCPQTWIFNDKTGFCYKAYSEAKPWAVADASCKAQGSHLASIHSLEESLFITNILPTKVFPPNTICDDIVQAWIGLHKNGPTGHWQWTDRTALDFTKWGQNWVPGYTKQPDAPLIHHCGELRKYTVCKGTEPGDFNDDHCDRALHHYVCKKLPSCEVKTPASNPELPEFEPPKDASVPTPPPIPSTKKPERLSCMV